MKKSTLAAQGTAGIAALALLNALAQADSARYSDISTLEIDMANAVTAASRLDAGEIIEIELETDDSRAVWELDIVDETNKMVTIEIDGQTGEILSTRADDDAVMPNIDALTLLQAIDIVKSVEQGALIEAELEDDHGALVWEVESIGVGNQKTTFRVDAETGEILI